MKRPEIISKMFRLFKSKKKEKEEFDELCELVDKLWELALEEEAEKEDKKVQEKSRTQCLADELLDKMKRV